MTAYLSPDHEFLPEGVTRLTRWCERLDRPADEWDREIAEVGSVFSGPAEPTPAGERPNLISSLCTDGLHRPVLDIDSDCEEAVPAIMRVFFELGSPGEIVWVRSARNWHAYLPTVAFSCFTWEDHDWAAMPHGEDPRILMDRVGQLSGLGEPVDSKWATCCGEDGELLVRGPWAKKVIASKTEAA